MTEQLASGTILLGRNRARRCEPSKRVPMQPEVFRGLARVQPLVCLVGEPVAKAVGHGRRYAIGEPVKH